MSCVGFIAQSPAVALTATEAKTILQIEAATDHAVAIKEWSISFDGESPTGKPITVEILRQSDVGAGGDALTLVKSPPDSAETLQTTALSDIDTTDPTDVSDSCVSREYIHPQAGYTYTFAFAEPQKLPGGAWMGMKVTPPAGVSVNSYGRFKCEE